MYNQPSLSLLTMQAIRMTEEQKQQVSALLLIKWTGFEGGLEFIQEKKIPVVVAMKGFTDFRFHNLKEDGCEHKASFMLIWKQFKPYLYTLAYLSFQPPLLCYICHLFFDFENSWFAAHILPKWNIYSTCYVWDFTNKWKNVFFLTIKPCRGIARYLKWSCNLWKKCTGITCILISLTCWIIFFLYNFKHY